MKGLWARKEIGAVLSEADEEPYRLKRVLGPVQITLLGIGAIIGAGIFATIGTAAAGDMNRPGAGPGLMLSFCLAGAVCALVAFCYAEFASRVPVAGSAYTYSYATLGEIVAWVIGWDLMIEYAVGNVAVAISWANYCKTLLREAGFLVPDWLSTDWQTAHRIPGLLESAPHLCGVPIVCNALALGITALITGVLLLGIRESAWANAVMVCIKLVVLVLFIIVGSHAVRFEHWQPFLPNGWHGVASGAAVVFFAFIGFDAVSTVAEEARNPQRDLPIGILASLVVCTVFYVLVAAVFTGMIPYSELVSRLSTQQAEPLTLALEYVRASHGVIFLVAFGSVVAHTAVLFVFQLGQTRIFFAMARDGLLPRAFCSVSSNRIPWGSTVFTGLAVGIAALVSPLEEMVDLTNIGTLFAFVLVCAGVIALRRKNVAGHGFRCPGGIYLPLLAIAGALGLIVYLPPASWLRFAAWLNIGVIVYVLYGMRHSRLTGEAHWPNRHEHLLVTAERGVYLGIASLGALVLAVACDALRSGVHTMLAAFLHPSAWLVVPVAAGFLVLVPVILLRLDAVRRSEFGALWSRRIRSAQLQTAGLMLLYAACVATLLR